jgi:hypothetical protein
LPPFIPVFLLSLFNFLENKSVMRNNTVRRVSGRIEMRGDLISQPPSADPLACLCLRLHFPKVGKKSIIFLKNDEKRRFHVTNGDCDVTN